MNFTRTKKALDEWENENKIKNEGVIDEEETDDPEKHASASFFPPESNKAHVSSSSHLSLIFALLGNRGKQSSFLHFSENSAGFHWLGCRSMSFSFGTGIRFD